MSNEENSGTKKDSPLEAMSNFRKKMERFIASGEPSPKKQKSDLQSRLNESEEMRKERVVSSYKKFLSPNDNETSLDELSLVASHKLFCSARELNASSQKENVSRLKSASPVLSSLAIVSSLSKKERYAHGEDIYFLRAWFCFEQEVSDLVPAIENGKLIFVPSDEFSFSPEEKETRSLIWQQFYC